MNNLAEILKDQVDRKTYLDVSKRAGNILGVSDTQLHTAIKQVADQGYKVFYLAANQNDTKKVMKVLVKDDVSWATVYENRNQIQKVEVPW